MAYSITLAGNDADPEDLQEVFENTVRALRIIGADVRGDLINNGVILNSSTVLDVEAADTEDEEI